MAIAIAHSTSQCQISTRIFCSCENGAWRQLLTVDSTTNLREVDVIVTKLISCAECLHYHNWAIAIEMEWAWLWHFNA